ncbi:hypothetical protein Tcan_07423, partial [Toxocara canis]
IGSVHDIRVHSELSPPFLSHRPCYGGPFRSQHSSLNRSNIRVMRPSGCVEDIVNNNAIRRSCPTSALKSSYCSTDKPYFGVCRECSRHSQLIGCQQLKQNQKLVGRNLRS